MADLRYLLDTNIVSDLVRHPQGEAAHHIAHVGEAVICTSIIVACELRFGANKKGSDRLSAQLEAVLEPICILPLEAGMDHQYASIRLALERRGELIGANDLLIAAQALALGLILVTANVDEFSRVHGLIVENWLDL